MTTMMMVISLSSANVLSCISSRPGDSAVEICCRLSSNDAKNKTPPVRSLIFVRRSVGRQRPSYALLFLFSRRRSGSSNDVMSRCAVRRVGWGSDICSQRRRLQLNVRVAWADGCTYDNESLVVRGKKTSAARSIAWASTLLTATYLYRLVNAQQLYSVSLLVFIIICAPATFSEACVVFYLTVRVSVRLCD